MHFAIEQRNWRKGWTWPWLVFGSNAIAAYMFSELLTSTLFNISMTGADRKPIDAMTWIVAHISVLIPNAQWAAFAYSVLFTAFCFVPVWILYRKKIFLKV